MVIDALMGLLTGGRRHLDEGGALARKGKAALPVVEALLDAPFFGQAPPRAAGREQFGREYAGDVLARCRKEKLTDASILATGTRLTAASIHQAYDRFVHPHFAVQELILSGGGAHNIALLEAVAELFDGVRVVTSDYYGLDVDAKEAAAFALLGHLSLEGEAGNVPAVTGASHPVVLGSITPGERTA
jgi:anhydro-N-acetylmuramic acid kinase